ncbi:MAG: DUF599 domain-containing protein [Gammaproteobacteria bacterium]|nr:DUF599 domain-containing protein [Gammaproteobacteria bacterium]
MGEGLQALDIAACSFLVVAWPAYTWFADYSRWSEKGLPNAVNQFRREWMVQMLGRELRMVDLLIQGNLVRGIAFFASTAILLVGGLLAVLGASEQAAVALVRLPFAVESSYAVVELKIVALVLIFVYAFVKFVWAFRLANYSSILYGAAPQLSVGSPLSEEYARHIGRISSITGRHFNQGLRANFFAIAVLGWFVHPALFMVATLWVVGLLYRREFRSNSLIALQSLQAAVQASEAQEKSADQ